MSPKVTRTTQGEITRANQVYWDTLSPGNARSDYYGADRVVGGGSSLFAIERSEIPDEAVAGRQLLHLQCHIGIDTLSWARLGATVTGLDFSPAAIAEARRLAGEARLSSHATFVTGDVLEAARHVPRQHDIVFTSYGVLMWLGDLRRWARAAADCLRPGGMFYMSEYHPALLSLADAPGIRPQFPYFGARPIHRTGRASYADEISELSIARYEWNHPVGNVVSALAGAGLRIEFLHEHNRSPEMIRACAVRLPDGAWHIPGDLVPMVYSIKAVKERRPG